jgi:hypothetical protein
MNRQKIGAGLMALALPVIALSMSVGSANAASVESTVTAMEECAWQVAGVPTTITLTSEDEEKYVGDELVVSSETPSTITVGLSGSVNPDLATSGTSTECTFYNDEKYPVLNVAMSSTSVRATYPGVGGVATEDPALTFNVGALNAFEVNTTQTCSTDFVTPVSVSELIDNSLTSLLSMIDESVVNEYVAGSGPRCPIDTSYSLTIPEISGTPAAPGAVYSFSGGSVSFVFAAN